MVRDVRDALPILGVAGTIVLLIAGAPPPLAAAWTTHGPYGGWVGNLAVDPSDPATLYAGTFRNGVFKSTDAGATWSSANWGLPSRGPIWRIAVDPSATSTLYAVGSTYAVGSSSVFKSTDGGASWTNLPAIRITFPKTLLVDPVTPSTVYAGGVSLEEAVLVKSDDRGASWSVLDLELARFSALVIDPVKSSTLYAGGAEVLKTMDGGLTWTSAATGLEGGDITALAIDPLTPETLYAAVRGKGIFRTTNGAASWNPLRGLGLRLLTISLLVVNPVNPSILYAGGFGGSGPNLYKSMDGGTSWVPVSEDRMTGTIETLAIDPQNPERIYTGTTSHGVFKSADGGAEWEEARTGLLGQEVFEVAVDPKTPMTLFAVTHTNEVFRSTDGGSSWHAVLKGGSNGMRAVAIDPVEARTVYAASGNTGVFRSADGGASWELSVDGLPFPANIADLVIDPEMPTTLYVGTSQGVYVSINGGQSWSTANAGLEESWITALAFDPLDSSILFAGGTDGLFRSLDGASTWTRLTEGLPDSGVYVLAAHPLQPSTLYAAAALGVFKTTDGGESWSALSGLPKRSITSIVIDPFTPTIIYVGGLEGELFRTTDGGLSWDSIDTTALHGLEIPSLALNPLDPQLLYVATDGSGVFRLNDVPELPAGPYMTSEEVPGFRFKARISAGDQMITGVQEADCIGETLCVSGALPGRSELFLRMIGPRPNGFLWTNLVRFTTSRVEVWAEQIGTGQINYYDLPALPREDTELTGLVDKEAFSPSGASQSAVAMIRHRPVGAPGVTSLDSTFRTWASPLLTGRPDPVILTSEAFPGYRFTVRIFSGGEEQPVQVEQDCIPETLCVSGALPGRSELFLRIIGPRPNGFLWTNLVRFTTSRVEVEIEQLDTGETKLYILEEVPRHSDELPGRVDRKAFFP